MYCPYCKHIDTKVLDSRDSPDNTLRRRRECLKCQKRFTTYERVETTNILVVKKDGTREQYNREKLRKGIVIACEKLPISSDRIDGVVDRVEKKLSEKKGEVSSKYIGELITKELKKVNKVAYIRFSAVYRQFADLESFEKELGKLIKKTKR